MKTQSYFDVDYLRQNPDSFEQIAVDLYKRGVSTNKLSPEEKEVYDIAVNQWMCAQAKHREYEDVSHLPDPPKYGVARLAERFKDLFYR